MEWKPISGVCDSVKSYCAQFNASDEAGLRGLKGEAGCLFLADYILGRIAPPQNGRVLDFGCGDGRVLAAVRHLRPDLTCVGIDFAEKLIAQAQAENAETPGLAFHVRDLLKDELALGEFDRIYSFSVIQYFSPPRFRSLNRALRSGLHAKGEVFHLSIPDLSKRVVLFQDDYLNHQARSPLAAAWRVMLLTLVDTKRRLTDDRGYGDSLFHDAAELAALAGPEYSAHILRPSDSWYRFDLQLVPQA